MRNLHLPEPADWHMKTYFRYQAQPMQVRTNRNVSTVQQQTPTSLPQERLSAGNVVAHFDYDILMSVQQDVPPERSEQMESVVQQADTHSIQMMFGLPHNSINVALVYQTIYIRFLPQEAQVHGFVLVQMEEIIPQLVQHIVLQ